MKRFTLPVITLLITALLVTLLWFPAAGAGASSAGHRPKPTPTPTPSPDFTISANYQPGAFTGFLAQGAIPGTPCQPCNGGTLPQPAYVSFAFGCFYDSNLITIFPFNGFLGTVNLTLSGLPSGVTSLTTTSVTVTQKGIPVFFPFKLQASSTATLGNATVTITGTSGSLVHSIGMPISVGTALPPC